MEKQNPEQKAEEESREKYPGHGGQRRRIGAVGEVTCSLGEPSGGFDQPQDR